MLHNFLALFAFLEVRVAEKKGTLSWEEYHRRDKNVKGTDEDMHIAGRFKR